MNNAQSFGNALFELRKKAGFSQEKLAESLNVSRQAVSKWECGESLPDTDNLIKIAKLLNVSLDELVGISSAEFTGNALATTFEQAEFSEWDNDDDDDDDDDDDNDDKNPYCRYDGTAADRKRKILRGLYNFCYPVFITAVFLLWGCLCDGWAIAWTLYVTVPVYYSIIDCIRTKRISPFNYPVFATFIYLFVGMQWHIWHPTWIIFVLIPVFYSIASAVDRK